MRTLNEIAERSVLTLEGLVLIEEILVESGYFSLERAREEMEWFIVELGIDDYYFRTTSAVEIARHLIALSASELITVHGGAGTGLQLIGEHSDRAAYIVEDLPEKVLEVESRIENQYSDFRLESYTTRGSSCPRQFRFYIVTKPVFSEEKQDGQPRTFEDAASTAFLSRALPETIERYRTVWSRMTSSETPFISVTQKPDSCETRIMIGTKSSGPGKSLTTLSLLLSKYGLSAGRKYVESFAGGIRITSLYLPSLEEGLIADLSRDLNVSLMLPDWMAANLFRSGALSPQGAMYAVSAAAFTHQFLSALTEEYLVLQNALKDQPEARGIVDNLKHHLLKDTFSTHRIAAVVAANPGIVEKLFAHFRSVSEQGGAGAVEAETQLREELEQGVASSKDRTILGYFLTFNNAVQRTNFFRPEKSCMAFRLDPQVLSRVDYPEAPYGLFLLVGRDFIGFHVRFRDIARGGIRIVQSRSVDAYAHNVDTIFSECYNLARTQQRKNKDIPEGGSKGAILLNLASQSSAERAFKDYVDGLLDLLIEVDEKGRATARELLFLGPDEGSAPLMDWASNHARSRGYPYWKSFSTGKAPELGGIPHDLFGMTTLGIHEYVLGLLEKDGLEEERLTKIQTGGPDGDLGSNEILLSKDRTIGVVDGSGVLFDPAGLDRKELVRLAKKRVAVDHFDRSLLSGTGFFVSVADRSVTLPDGNSVANGEVFRNTFHLSSYARADLFVPCGGRPGAINIGNWQSLLDEGGTPKFRFIVEGANLFITEDARLRLEERGVLVFKDASTNKGGVTSSSLEVLASLALKDDEYDASMRVVETRVPRFRQTYVSETIANIRRNARAEFELLWREFSKTGAPLSRLSDDLSERINRIADAIRTSSLVEDPAILSQVLNSYAPESLIDLVGLPSLTERLPAPYRSAVVAAKIATDFVYGSGLGAKEVEFADFIAHLKAQGA